MTDFNINSNRVNLAGYRQTILGDWIRPWMFALEIPPVEGGTVTSRTITALVRSTKLPGYKIKTESIAYQGLTMNVASVAQFEQSLQIKILGDHTHNLHSKFTEWAAAAYEPGYMYSAAPTSYKVDNVLLHQLDRTGAKVITYRFYGTLCESVGAWSVGQSDTKPAEFDVTLKYDFFTQGYGNNFPIGVDVGANTDKAGIITGPVLLKKDKVVVTTNLNTSGDQQPG